MAYIPHETLEQKSEILYQSAPLIPVALAVHEIEPGVMFRAADVVRFTGLSGPQVGRGIRKLVRFEVVEDRFPGSYYYKDLRFLRLESPAWQQFTLWYEILDIEPSDLFNPSWASLQVAELGADPTLHAVADDK